MNRTITACVTLVMCLSVLAAVAESAPSVSFERAPELYGDVPTFQVALGDLDGDGDLDAVFANMGFNHSLVLFNDGAGHFEDSGQTLTQQGHGLGIGDLDGDHDLDLFVTCAGYGDGTTMYNKPSRVYLNDGNGTFHDTGQDLGDTVEGGNLVQLLDIDMDGDLDVFVLYYGSPSRIYLNDGRGRFTQSAAEYPFGISWADLNDDGAVDAFIKDEGTGYSVLLNQGNGTLIDHWKLPASSLQIDYSNAAFADLDGDGDIDVLDTNGERDRAAPSTVLLNDGTGRFTAVAAPHLSSHTAWINLGDVNGDGRIDAFVCVVGQPNQVWINEGSGQLSDSGLRLGGTGSARGTALGDVDGDGDLDAFVAMYGIEGGPNELWINTSSHADSSQ
ncbi:FG-GAP repeat domain-containing protein [Candidatus Bipolaricaulota bacterium]